MPDFSIENDLVTMSGNLRLCLLGVRLSIDLNSSVFWRSLDLCLLANGVEQFKDWFEFNWPSPIVDKAILLVTTGIISICFERVFPKKACLYFTNPHVGCLWSCWNSKLVNRWYTNGGRGLLTFDVEKKMVNLVYPFFTNSLENNCIYIHYNLSWCV